MYASVRVYDGVDPSGVREITQAAQQGLIPLLRQQPGFIDYMLVHASEGVWATISLFDDREGAEASAVVSGQWLRETLAHLVKSPPRVIMGEVVAKSSDG